MGSDLQKMCSEQLPPVRRIIKRIHESDDESATQPQTVIESPRHKKKKNGGDESDGDNQGAEMTAKRTRKTIGTVEAMEVGSKVRMTMKVRRKVATRTRRVEAAVAGMKTMAAMEVGMEVTMEVGMTK
jgi:hypothetical protein